MAIILAVDPGNVTGIAWYDTSHPEDKPEVEEIEGGLRGFVDWWDRNARYLNEDDSTFEVCIEDFIIRPDTHKKTREPAAYETLGYVKGTCFAAGSTCYVYGPSEHTPFSAYKIRKASKLVRLGWSTPSKDMHADSATSVLLLHLVRRHPAVARKLLKEIVMVDDVTNG